jgi:hypothetical protein
MIFLYISGCLLALYGVKTSDSLFTLAENTTEKYPLSNVTTDGYSRFAVGVTCSMKAETSTYLSCNGEWEQLNSTLVTKRFRISYGEPHDSKYNVHFRVSLYHVRFNIILFNVVTVEPTRNEQ